MDLQRACEKQAIPAGPVLYGIPYPFRQQTGDNTEYGVQITERPRVSGCVYCY